MTAYILRFSVPGGAWQFQTINRDDFSLGRIEGNDLVLPSESVSRQHARLRFQNGQIWLVDLNSSNGTLLNGQRIPPNQWVAIPLGQFFKVGEFYVCVDPLQGALSGIPQASAQAFPTIKAPLQPQPAAPVMAAPPQPSAAVQHGRARPWLIGGGMVVLLAVVFVAAFLLAQRGLTSPEVGDVLPNPQITQTPAEEPQKVLASLPVQPGSSPVKDANGVALDLAAGSMPEGQSATLISTQLGSMFTQKLGEGYRVESPAYSISAGSSDALEGAALSFPAKSDAARLAVLIDGKYFGVLDTPPQNGQLTVEAPVASTDFDNPAKPAPVKGSATQFFVVSPKTQSSLPNSYPNSGMREVNYHPQDADGKSCVAEFWTANNCWRNLDKTIYVFWEDDYPASLKNQEYLRVVDTIRSITQIMGAYVSKGFTTAALSSSRPIYIVIDAGLKEANYSPQTRTIYLDWGFVANSGGAVPDCTVAHELMHLIEHKKYWMIPNYYSNSKAWWLDMAAEMGSFTLNPACVNRNLTTYGTVTTNADVLGFQASPFTWDRGEQARYIQAQQVWISTCSGGAGCALTQDDFVQAIINGTFPLDSGQAQEVYQRNAKDLGLYLLGAAPQASRTDVAIPTAAISGQGYGDYVVLKGGPKAGFEFGLTNSQFNRKAGNEVQVTAAIQKGGVYPLWVGNGKGTPLVRTDLPGLPGVLKIEAGTPFWISLDGGAPKFYDGSKALSVAPLSATLGKGLARIAAVAPDGDKSFQASLSLADFSGDWSANISGQQATLVDCKGGESSGEAKPADDTFLQIFSGMGTYQLDPAVADGSHLIWNGTLPQGINGTSEITIKPDGLVLTYRLDQPKSTSMNWLPGLPPMAASSQAQPITGLSLGLPVIPLLALIARKRKPGWRRMLLLAAMLASLTVLLSGCFGMGIYGTLDATYTFKKAEFVDPQTTAAGKTAVNWNLSAGSVKFVIDYTIEATTTDSKGVDTTETSRCKMIINANAIGTIGPEDSVIAPNLGQAK
jgi:hypothetical protein